MSQEAVTSARVDIITGDNVSFIDAFQFGVTGDTSWSFVGQNFRMDIKGNRWTQTAPLVSLNSTNNQIVVVDPINRILNFNASEATLNAGLLPGEYWYDFIMYDNSNPAVRIALMHGKFKFYHGITGG